MIQHQNNNHNKLLEDIKLQDGELICDKCDGTGKDDPTFQYSMICSKCQGRKKLDWISKITGVPKLIGTDSSSGGTPINFNNIPKVQNTISIVGNIIDTESEKSLKGYMKKYNKVKRGKFFDHRIFSKFMFFRNSK